VPPVGRSAPWPGLLAAAPARSGGPAPDRSICAMAGASGRCGCQIRRPRPRPVDLRHSRGFWPLRLPDPVCPRPVDLRHGRGFWPLRLSVPEALPHAVTGTHGHLACRQSASSTARWALLSPCHGPGQSAAAPSRTQASRPSGLRLRGAGRTDRIECRQSPPPPDRLSVLDPCLPPSPTHSHPPRGRKRPLSG